MQGNGASDRDLEEDGGEDEGPLDVDPFLQRLVYFMNRSGGEMGITLNVGGVLVSGMLTSGRAYFEALRGGFRADLTAEKDLRRVYDEYFQMWMDLYPPPADDGEGAVPTPYPEIIHLRDAQFYGAGGQPLPSRAGVWWRGRLASVEGFFIGRLEAAQPGPDTPHR